MKNSLCSICVGVCSLWITLSAGMAWGFLAAEDFLVPISLLMGGSVAGIAYLGEKRCAWAAQNPKTWKSLVIFGGMTLAYILVSHLSKMVVIIELIIMLNLAYLFFFSKPKNHHSGTDFPSGDETLERVKEIEKQMEQCC